MNALLSSLSLIAAPMQDVLPNKQHIPYLIQHQHLSEALDAYTKYRNALGRHDFQVLQQMALSLLEEGVKRKEVDQQLIAIFGCGIAGISSATDILESAITSPEAEAQLAAIQYLGRLQDDRTEELLTKAMSSPFLIVRLEAAYILAGRKSRTAVGQIEALMYRLPRELSVFFPEFFALIGTADAMSVLRKLMDDSFPPTKIEAILCAAKYGRDDVLPMIRACASHLNFAEQEACAAALGYLRDSSSIPRLHKLKKNASPPVQLAALRALYLLGDTTVKTEIETFARTGNVFAIALLGDIEGSEDVLAELTQSRNIQVRLNAAVSLCKRKDPRSFIPLREILIRDVRDLGFIPHFSLGRSLMAWKVIPSSEQHLKEYNGDLRTITLGMREQVLRLTLELPQPTFLEIARLIFDSKQTEFIPTLTSLLENLRTPEAISLLQTHAQKAGAPLIRAYCNLSCFRLKIAGPHEQAVLDWLNVKKSTEMIRFRPLMPQHLRFVLSSFELTPEESARLLIESYETLADRHEEQSIDRILDAIKEGNPKNRYVLAGLLLRAIQ